MRGDMSVQRSSFERGEIGRDGAAEAEIPAAIRMSSARSRSGGISVVTTPQGLPTRVRIERSQLTKQPQALADEILRVCRQSAMAAGIRWREELLDAGAPRDVVDAMGLPTAEDLARVEYRDDEHDDAPASWLRRA